jgi:hypothetical protein
MRTTLIFVLFFIALSACNKTVYVPVESVRTEYRDNYLRDSIFLYDSVFLKIKGDTVWIEKYKYLYRDKTVRDSVFLNDTIRVPYPVEVLVEVPVKVNYVSFWQNVQIWLGRLLILIVSGYLVFGYLKKRFFVS